MSDSKPAYIIKPHGCGRCEKVLAEVDRGFCWFCNGDLCDACHTAIGHCGHTKADDYLATVKKK